MWVASSLHETCLWANLPEPHATTTGHDAGRKQVKPFPTLKLNYAQNCIDIQEPPLHSIATLASLLKQYGNAKSLLDGKHLHSYITMYGFDHNTFLGNSLVQMYGNSGSIDDARAVFDQLNNSNLYSWNIMINAYAQNGMLDDARSLFHAVPCRDVVSWSVLIGAYAGNGYDTEAIQLFRLMRLDNVQPNAATFLSALDACASQAILEDGQEIHAIMVEGGFEQDCVLGTALINMYSKCRSLDDAWHAFDRLAQPDAISWNAMITACSQNGHGKHAMELFSLMGLEPIKPDNVTFTCILLACAGLMALEDGQRIHLAIVDDGYEQDVGVGTALISMYGKCKALNEANDTFCSMTHQNVVSWSAMIAACVNNDHDEEAFELFYQMQHEGIEPNEITFVSILKACASQAILVEGERIHATILGNGFEQDEVVRTALVSMYAKCGSLEHAKQIFLALSSMDTVSWNAMIAACAQNGHGKEAVHFFHQMQREDVKPCKITFISVLDACTGLTNLEESQLIHSTIISNGYAGETDVGNAVIHMYGEHGDLNNARIAFRCMPHWDVVSWSTMIAVCGQHRQGGEALELFHCMYVEGFTPDKITFICILEVCACLEALKEGQQVHAVIVSSEVDDDVVIGTSLIKMYGKCGSLDDVRNVFDRLFERDVVSWNSTMAACVHNNHAKEALELFYKMQLEEFKPNEISFISSLDACSTLVSLEEGQVIHASIVGSGYETVLEVANALINMYGKCGNLHDTKTMLLRTHHRNVISWNAVLSAYSRNGLGKETLKLYHEMHFDGVKPNEITFLCVLAACSHAGQVNAGRHLFLSMKKDHGINHSVEHYICMIDLLGRAGHLDEAQELTTIMPFKTDNVTWLSFLGACRIHGDVNRAVPAANSILDLDPENGAAHVLLSNIHATAEYLYK